VSEAIVDCDAVLFDMDGTLVDSREIVERLWLQWAAEHGLSAAAILAVAHGRRTLETIQLVAPHLATAETAVPGAAALLNALPPDRWAVVTSAGRKLAAARLAVVGLPLPRVLVGADDVARGKPSPEGYLRAAELFGVAPDRCLVLEDTPAGAQAGRAAGARVVGLRTTFPSVDGCDFLVRDLRAIRLAETLGRARIRLIIDEA
jgi:sugar-phosphatase